MFRRILVLISSTKNWGRKQRHFIVFTWRTSNEFLEPLWHAASLIRHFEGGSRGGVRGDVGRGGEEVLALRVCDLK